MIGTGWEGSTYDMREGKAGPQQRVQRRRWLKIEGSRRSE